MQGTGDERIAWSPETQWGRADLADAIERFRAPTHYEAGVAATKWLREEALDAHPGSRTQLLMVRGEVVGFYSLSMGEVLLTHVHRKKLIERVRLHADLIILARLGQALNRARAVSLAA